MDVKCERCSTEYEFDDALVSGRGTTVRCTNCGFKFKIHRTGGDFSEDYWNVTTGDGRTLVFTSLRELQRAISGHLVGRTDRISRGGLPPKPIGDIPELLPFFAQRDTERARHEPPTPGVLGEGGAPVGPARARQGTKPDFLSPPPQLGVPDERVGKTTLIGTGPLRIDEAFAAPAAPPAASTLEPGPEEPAPDTERAPPPSEARAAELEARAASAPPPPQAPVDPPSAPGAASAPEAAPAPAGGPAATPAEILKSHAAAAPVPPAATPAEILKSHAAALPEPAAPAVAAAVAAPGPALGEERSAERAPARARRAPEAALLPARRRPVGGFIVAAVVVVCVLMLAAVWARKNLGAALGPRTPALAPAADPRVAGFLAAGEEALAAGHLELAKESFDKASALADDDPQVRIGLSRLAVVRADLLWIKARLLPEGAADEHRVTRDALADLAARARSSADEALAAVPDEPAALRAKIDALRIEGDRDGARALVAKLGPGSGTPEGAYVLAMLDLAEAEPLWQAILDRLRTAAGAEAGPGRARAAFIYALARAGEVSEATAELERLRAMPKAHELLPLLRRFVEEAEAASASERDAAAEDAATAEGEPADAGAAPAIARRPAATPTDPRELVKQAEGALARGDRDRARALFSAALEKSPNDSEALAGLAAIAHAERDLLAARSAYKRVLVTNPSYLPALVGLADVEWDSGDTRAAVKMYKEIVDRYPDGAYPARIKQRIEGGG